MRSCVLSPTLPSPTRHPLHRFKAPGASRSVPSIPFSSSSSSYSTNEVPIDEDFLKKYAPKEKESEEEARRRNWIERGWAPWEEILTPEADFARKSLNEGEEVPLRTPEAIEAFKMLKPSYRRKRMEESGLSEEELLAQQFAVKGEIPELIETTWAGGVVAVRAVPPRDWPPRDWEVDAEELEFIRGAHKLEAERVYLEEEIRTDVDSMCVERYKVFLKQYKEWVAANRERLEGESYKFDQDYYPGRRKRGKDYKDDMLELPYIYPGQGVSHAIFTVSCMLPYLGKTECFTEAQVYFLLLSHVCTLLAKRDPYRFRFPIELRFLYPNIDHLIFNRFDFPPVFHREEDTNPEQLWRECGRPPIPRKRPPVKMEDQSLLSDHPYVDRLWQLHVAEQMILDDEEAHPEKYMDQKFIENALFDEENSIQYTKAYYEKALLPMTILAKLDLDAARAENQLNKKLRKEAEERGEVFQVSKLKRNREMDEYDLMHWRRSLEEREALVRDISCRKALGLPLEEPGRYDVNSAFWKNKYDPTNPLYRYDYWGEPKHSEKSRQQRITEDHNRSIVGNGTVWYEMSYEETIKQRMRREAQMKNMPKETKDVEEGDDDEDDLDFDYSIFSNSSNSSADDKPLVNGTESPRLSDEGLFEN
ncbi:hypothetical protein MA16_Dca017009 [Dendrobium catenatum]|uniref:Protein PLASTID TRANSCRIPTIONALLY ACTIVE 10 n=1 Tax=Dendrobium catenatum TaxID=906689 RepID=A0A2I0XEV1_9ASPA|nr:hypothetical protein MA16_Dca017009 [Dendrobium catenatum]